MQSNSTSSSISFPVNPWSAVAIHPLNKMLSISNRDGCPLSPDAEIQEEYKETSMANAIHHLRKIATTSADIRKTRGHIKDHSLYVQSCDLTCTEALQNKLENVRELLTALELAIKNQSCLTQRLQQPHQGWNLTIEAKYHPNAVNFFHNTALIISSLQEDCKVLKWHTTNELCDDGMQKSLHDVSKRISKVQEEIAVLQSNQ